MVGRRRQGWALYARDARAVRRRHRDHLCRRDARHARDARGRPARGSRTPPTAGQGAALRHLPARRCSCRPGPPAATARSTAAWSPTPALARRGDGEHHDRRGDLRRPRLRAVRDAAAGGARRVPRGSDGRAHTEYLGKKIRTREVELAALGTLFVPILVLVMTAIAIATAAGRQSLSRTARRASRSRSTHISPRPTTTVPRSPATRVSFSPPPGTWARMESPSRTLSGAR